LKIYNYYHPKDGTAINLNDNKVAGVKLGRPRGVGKSKLDEFKEEIVALLRNGSSKKFVADRYGTSQVNLYNWLKKNNLNVTCQKASV
jgi:DNA invertase Pin-like site-specific DNA recombinase